MPRETYATRKSVPCPPTVLRADSRPTTPTIVPMADRGGVLASGPGLVIRRIGKDGHGAGKGAGDSGTQKCKRGEQVEACSFISATEVLASLRAICWAAGMRTPLPCVTSAIEGVVCAKTTITW